jgi:signal transduction histidine kinase
LTVTNEDCSARTLTDTIRVLVVDDVPDIRKLIRLTLERCGPFTVVGEAGDGAQAIAEAARLRPDIVLLDLSMPVMDGLEALPEILAASPDSKVLVLSGFTAGEMSDEAIKRGASGYMEKGGIVGKLGPRLRELVPFRAVTFDDKPDDTAVRAATQAAKPPLDGDLMALLIRDLSRPLTVLHALASRLLRADELPPEAVRSALAAVTREAKRLEEVLRSYADAGKLESGALDLALAPTNLSQLIRNCIADLADLTSLHPVTVEMDDNVVINVDPTRIREVVSHLLSNAAKFSPSRAPIEVTSLFADSAFEVHVRDHGPGIPAEYHDRIFEKFGRVDPDAVGNGLGLYLARQIARAHGGDVFLASCDDTGCVFALRLRVAR